MSSSLSLTTKGGYRLSKIRVQRLVFSAYEDEVYGESHLGRLSFLQQPSQDPMSTHYDLDNVASRHEIASRKKDIQQIWPFAGASPD